MSDKTFSALLYAISADVVKRLCAGGMGLGEALRAFYSSRLYALLENRETGLWCEPTPVLLALFGEERNGGANRLDWSV